MLLNILQCTVVLQNKELSGHKVSIVMMLRNSDLDRIQTVPLSENTHTSRRIYQNIRNGGPYLFSILRDN